jgi:hypothetical protein
MVLATIPELYKVIIFLTTFGECLDVDFHSPCAEFRYHVLIA